MAQKERKEQANLRSRMCKRSHTHLRDAHGGASSHMHEEMGPLAPMRMSKRGRQHPRDARGGTSACMHAQMGLLVPENGGLCTQVHALATIPAAQCQ